MEQEREQERERERARERELELERELEQEREQERERERERELELELERERELELEQERERELEQERERARELERELKGMGTIIPGYKTVYCDIDETLVMQDLSAYSTGGHEFVMVQYKNGPVEVVVNEKNRNLLIYFHKLGYEIILWSKTGADWANAVGERLGLDEMVSVYLTKPTFYIDDQDVSEWIGKRRWRACE